MAGPQCPKCGSTKFKEKSKGSLYGFYVIAYCEDCGAVLGTFNHA